MNHFRTSLPSGNADLERRIIDQHLDDVTIMLMMM